jgi:hypothetical protein
VRDPFLINGSRTQSRVGEAGRLRRGPDDPPGGATLDRWHFDAVVMAVRRRHADVS